MREECEGNSLVFLLVLFIILSAFLCFYIVFNKIYINKNNEILESCREYSDSVSSLSKDNKKIYTIDDVAGYYKGEDFEPRFEGDDITFIYGLELNSNGTFVYLIANEISNYIIGNYIIKDDTIILNHLYKTCGGACKQKFKGQTTLKIKGKDKLSLMEVSNTKDMKEIILNKKERESNYTYDNILKYAEMDENTHTS